MSEYTPEPLSPPAAAVPQTPSNPTSQRQRASQLAQALRQELHKALIGQNAVVDDVLTALIAGGHVLIEGVPGLGKTLLVRALARCFGGEFARIQFTPDLMPSDVTGHAVYDLHSEQFKLRKGPVFTNLLLADEINRAPAKTQAALLEVMQERQVTLEGRALAVPLPFMVLATQNPIDQEGTYTLPEAQLDRFLLKIRVTYPTPVEERMVLDAMATSAPKLDVSQVTDVTAISASRVVVNDLFMDEKIRDYIVALIHATRHPEALAPHLKLLIRCGASPRGTINLALAAKALAFLNGRNYVIPQDIKDLAPDILRHRILLSYEAEAEGVTTDDVVKTLLDKLPVP